MGGVAARSLRMALVLLLECSLTWTAFGSPACTVGVYAGISYKPLNRSLNS